MVEPTLKLTYCYRVGNSEHEAMQDENQGVFDTSDIYLNSLEDQIYYSFAMINMLVKSQMKYTLPLNFNSQLSYRIAS